MGLSVVWSTYNIGATKPEEYGWFFQWAGTTAYNSDCTPVDGDDAINFGFNSDCPYWVSGTSRTSTIWSKYTAIDSYSSTGTADNKTVLELVDDVAHVHIGGKCRMPTNEEYDQLINVCNITWVTDYNGSGVNGNLFTLKSDTSKTLFFPAAGYLASTSWYYKGSNGYYWASSLDTSRPYAGRALHVRPDGCYTDWDDRDEGYPVRAVFPKK